MRRRRLSGVRRVHGHIDLQRRAEVGAAGEKALVAALRRIASLTVDHVALRHDGFGYDIAVVLGDDEWHVEVKSTSRRARLPIHLSRQEYEVGRQDAWWRLVVVGLDSEQLSLRTVATVDANRLFADAPLDRGHAARWISARFDVPRTTLRRGLPFLAHDDGVSKVPELAHGGDRASDFSWMPDP